MNVAQDFPARTDDNGNTWYRPVRDKGMDLSQWGWTSNPELAHPDYAAAVTVCELPTNVTAHDRAAILELQQELDQRSKEASVSTELTTNADGEPEAYNDPWPRRSEICGFPLPPFPEQVNVEMDGWKRYKLPSPTTGKLTAYTRATTVAGVTPDDYNLVQWKIREKVAATIDCAMHYDWAEVGAPADIDQRKVLAYQEYLEALDAGQGKKINAAIDKMHDICGGAESREHGGAVHDWIAELDMGRVLLHQIPEQYQVHARAYQDAMARAGLIAIPEYTERLVLNTSGIETIAGRLDGIAYCVETGEWHVIDRKTSKTLDFSALEFGLQICGIYAGSDLMLAPDRKEWLPMPEVSQELAFVIHVPSDQPERSQVVPLAVGPGVFVKDTALDVRAQRRQAKEVFLGQTYPVPSEASLRYVAARQRLQDLRDLADAQAIMQEYEDVWDDGLAEFGAQCFELLDTDTDNEE